MTVFHRLRAKSTPNEREFCRALLNHENPLWGDLETTKPRRRVHRLPPDDFIYGLKHPKPDSSTGVAAALQYNDFQTDLHKSPSQTVPDFIAINKLATRLGLTKVRDIHHYRKTMTEHHSILNSCYHPCSTKDPVPGIVHGRPTGDASFTLTFRREDSIRDVLANKYLHEWLEETAVRRCKEILRRDRPRVSQETSLSQQQSVHRVYSVKDTRASV